MKIRKFSCFFFIIYFWSFPLFAYEIKYKSLPSLFINDNDFKEYLKEEYKDTPFIYTEIGTTEHLDPILFYVSEGGVSLPFRLNNGSISQEHYLLTEAYLDYINKNKNKSATILESLKSIEFQNRPTYSQPFFISHLIKVFGRNKSDFQSLLEFDSIENPDDKINGLKKEIEDKRPEAFERGSKWGYVEVDINSTEYVLKIVFLHFLKSKSGNVAGKLLNHIYDNHLADLYWDTYYVGANSLQFIYKNMNEYKNFADAKEIMLPDEYDFFGDIDANDEVKHQLLEERKSLLNKLPGEVSHLNWRDFKQLVTVIEDYMYDIDLELDNEYEDDFDSQDVDIKEIKRNDGFRNWLAGIIGDREPRASDIKNIASPFTLSLMNQGLFNIEEDESRAKMLRDEEFINDVIEDIWREAYNGYQQWRKDAKHRTCLTKLKSDNHFTSWLNKKLHGGKLNVNNFNSTFEFTFSDFPTYSKTERERLLYEQASWQYGFEGYALSSRGCTSPQELVVSLRESLSEMSQDPIFRGICKTKSGIMPQFRVVTNAKYTGYAYQSIAPIIDLNVTDLAEYNDATSIWHILHECAHHVLDDTSTIKMNREAIPEQTLKQIELRADCWAGYQITKIPLSIPDKNTRLMRANVTGTDSLYTVHADLKKHEKKIYGYPAVDTRINESIRCAKLSHLSFDKTQQ